LVTEDGVEVLTARSDDSPGGKVPMPVIADSVDEQKVDGTIETK
jgi:hypothetical protein